MTYARLNTLDVVHAGVLHLLTDCAWERNIWNTRMTCTCLNLRFDDDCKTTVFMFHRDGGGKRHCAAVALVLARRPAAEAHLVLRVAGSSALAARANRCVIRPSSTRQLAAGAEVVEVRGRRCDDTD